MNYKHGGFIFGYIEEPFLSGVLLVLSILAIVLTYTALYNHAPNVKKRIPVTTVHMAFGIVLGLVIIYAFRTRNETMLDKDIINYLITPFILFNTGYFLSLRAVYINSVEIMLLAILNTFLNIMVQTFFITLFHPLYEMDITIYQIFLFSCILTTQTNYTSNNILLVYEGIFSGIFTLTMFDVFSSINVSTDDSPVLYVLFMLFLKLIFNVVVSLTISIVMTVALLRGLKELPKKYRDIANYVISFAVYVLVSSLNLSGSMAIIMSAILLKRYNRAQSDTFLSLARTMGMLAQSILLLLFGLVTISLFRISIINHNFDPAFVFLTLLSSIVSRFLIMFGIVPLVNIYRRHYNKTWRLDKNKRILDYKTRFLMGYSNVRGVISVILLFDMPESIDQSILEHFRVAAVFDILFSIFIVGSSMRYVELCLDIDYKDDHDTYLHSQLVLAHHPIDNKKVTLDEELVENRLENLLTQEIDAIHVLKKPIEISVQAMYSIKGLGTPSGRIYKYVGFIDSLLTKILC